LVAFGFALITPAEAARGNRPPIIVIGSPPAPLSPP
jgi:hypothetical protein